MTESPRTRRRMRQRRDRALVLLKHGGISVSFAMWLESYVYDVSEILGALDVPQDAK